MIDGLFELIKDIPEFFRFLWRDFMQALREGVRFALFFVLGGTLALFSAILFILVPLVVPWLYVQTWWRGHKGIGRAAGVGVLLIVAVVITTGL